MRPAGHGNVAFWFFLGGGIDMTTKYAIFLINKMRKWWYESPKTYDQKKVWFEYDAYKSSAIKEIKIYLTKHNKDPVEAIEEFRNLMNDFICRSKRDSSQFFMFSVYYDVATDILDVLLGVN